MEFLSEYIQVMVTLGVILGTAVIAGICDALKTNNENLRAELLEMQIRLDQLGGPRKAVNTPSEATPVAESEKSRTRVEEESHRRPPRASRMRRAAAGAGREPRRAPSADAIAVMQQGLQMAGAETVASTATAASKPEISAAPRNATEPAKRTDETPRDAKTLASPEAGAATAASPASAQDPAGAKSRLSSLGRTLVPEEVEDPSTFNGIPVGFQEGHVLTRMVQTHQPVSGLIISVGVAPGSPENGAPPLGKVEKLIRSLLGNEDFAAQSAENEYLLIFPHQRGAAAQRKLSEVTQQLWDYQIQSAGGDSILFNWGGVEVSAQPIDDAISSANERMRQTKRHRLALPPQSAAAGALRQAG